jgi:hypothetical protein
MLDFIIFCIIVYSMANIIIEQKIFEEARMWLNSCANTESSLLKKKICQLIKCHYCTGFWCGVFIILSGFDPFDSGTFDFLYGGLLGALTSYIFYLLMLRFRMYLNKEGISEEFM